MGGTVYKSDNGGDKWSKLNDHFTMLTVWGQPQLIVDPSNASTAYAATWLGGTWKTADAGQIWTLLDKAPVSSTALTMDQSNPSFLVAADRIRPWAWRSSDGGNTWADFVDFSSQGAFLVNRVSVQGGILYLSTFGPGLHGGKLYKSGIFNTTWTDITGTLPRSVLDVAVNPSDPQTIYVTTHIHGAYKSTNGGGAWMELNNFPNIGGYDIEVDPVNPDIIYAAGMGSVTIPNWVMAGGYILTDPSGVYKSTDAGATWTRILTTSNECRAIRIHPDNHQMLFAAALDDGLMVSTDGGATWNSYNNGLDIRLLTSCAVNGNKIYVGTQGCGVYAGDLDLRSGSIVWSAARSNKPVPAVYNVQITVDPKDSSRIYVSANPGGLFRSDDGMFFAVSSISPPGKAILLSPSGSTATNTPAYRWNAVPSATWYSFGLMIQAPLQEFKSGIRPRRQVVLPEGEHAP